MKLITATSVVYNTELHMRVKGVNSKEKYNIGTAFYLGKSYEHDGKSFFLGSNITF